MSEKTVGLLAKFTGVSVHTLKHYEKIGLLSTHRKKESNYRLYGVRFCTDVFECVKYRKLGIGLKDTGTLVKEADDGELNRILASRARGIEEEIRELQDMKRMLAEYQERIREVDENLGRWYIEEQPDLYVRFQTENLEYGEEASMEVSGINLTDYMPRSMSVLRVARETLNGGENHFNWGQGIFCRKGEWPEEIPGFFHQKGSRMFVTYLKLTGPYASRGEIGEKIRSIYREFSPEAAGDAFCVRIKITHDQEGRDWNYFKVLIPLEK